MADERERVDRLDRGDKDEFIGRRMRQAREEMGLTQEDLARQLNITGASLSRWEAGKHSIHGSDLIKLSHLLGKPPEWFLGEEVRTEDILLYNILSMTPAEQNELMEYAKYLRGKRT